MNFSATNNFDLIRLFAASQVAITHCAYHLGYKNTLLSVVSLFPGVPIFFFVSGFLIYGSFEKSSHSLNPIRNFFIKRTLRLYPALLFCLILSTLSIWQSGYFEKMEINIISFLTWLLAQSTFFQFYNPDFLRSYGVGVINGSLWTISVEIQFYILTPFIFLAFNRLGKYVLFGAVLAFIITNILNAQFNERAFIIQKLFGVSFIPWLYMFLLGALCYKYQQIISYIKKVPFLAICLIFAFTYYLTFNLGWGNQINLIGYIALVVLVVKCAFTLPNISDFILRRNDFSYGIYIMHMPIVNYLLYLNIDGWVSFFTLLC